MRFLRRSTSALSLIALAALPLFASMARPQDPAAPAPAPAPQLRESNRVPGEVRFTFHDEVRQPVGEGTIHFRSERSGSAWAELRRYRAYAGVDSFEWKRPAQGLIRIDDRIVTSVGGQEVVQSEQGTGLPQDCYIGLHIDPVARTYSFTFDIATKTRTELRGPLADPDLGESQGGFSYASPDLPLPRDGALLEGEALFQVENADGRLGTHLVEIGKTLRAQAGQAMPTVQVRWRFGRPAPMPPLELVLRAENHERWLPEGPLPPAAEGTAGNRIALIAELRSKDGSALPRGAVAMSFELFGVSTEPGYALSYPLEAAHDPRAFDLGFVEGGDAAPLAPRAQTATTPIGDWRAARALVGAFDWGAYGAVRAKAYVAHHGELVAVIEGSEERELRLPRRSSSSAIADAWKQSFGVADRADDDDAERTSGNAHDGDGLTLYEEYRGLFGRGQHSRHDALCGLDPRRKDLVVAIGERGAGLELATLRPLEPRLADARRGFALFESASRGIHIAEVLESELPESRCLNANRRTATKGAQHGILLFDSGPMPDGGETSEGSTVGGAYPLELQRKTPAKTRFVAIACAEIEDGYRLQSEAAARAKETLPYTAAEELASTFAHELAHACGVNHHGNREGSGPYTTLGVEHTPPRYRAFDVDGVELLQRPLVLGGAIGGPQSRASGDPTCILCYNNLFQWFVTAERGVGYRWRALRPGKPGTTFCTAKDGEPPNAAFGEAGSAGGLCLGKLRVRDW